MWLDSRCGSVFVNGSPQVPLPGIGHGKAGAKPNEKGLMTRTRNKGTFKCLMSDDIFYGQGLVFDFWIYLYLALAVMEPTWIRSR
jgi:hypothetical protein